MHPSNVVKHKFESIEPNCLKIFILGTTSPVSTRKRKILSLNFKSVKMKSDINELLFLKFEDLVQVWFEKNTNVTKSEFNNDWIDPYDSICLKLLSVILYAIEIFESLIMITFVNYETAGYFGHYRTLINQLLSHLYGGVSIFLRLWCLLHFAPCTLLHSSTIYFSNFLILFVPCTILN